VPRPTTKNDLMIAAKENYEKLKKSTKASMETLISVGDYWKLTSQK